MTYHQQSKSDRGTACYFRNFLNLRNVKGEVKNSFRAYKQLYYTVFDAVCCLLFLQDQNVDSIDNFKLPDEFEEKSAEQKIEWLNTICGKIIDTFIFEGQNDLFQQLRDILTNPEHPENYWIGNESDGRFSCHFCTKTYLHVGTLQAHEKLKHNHTVPLQDKRKSKSSDNADQLYDYILLLFKLTALLKNLDTSIDMADGGRSVQSCKYELPIFNRTNKIKYVIGCVHLTALAEETLSPEQRHRLIWNRSVNLQGGKNNNIALDEYLEMLNRDSKEIVTGHQTKESIISHSKQFPHLINYSKHFDNMTNVRKRKGFHKLPNYKTDVRKVMKELEEINALRLTPKRTLLCKEVCFDRDPFSHSFRNLPTLIHRHKPKFAFGRLRDKHY